MSTAPGRWRRYPQYKASGVEWLGEVPEGWEVRAFRHLVLRLDQGWSPVASTSPAGEGEWGVLKLSAVRQGSFIPSENKALDTEEAAPSAVTPRAGDLLISRANTPDRVGDVCVVQENHPLMIVPDLLYRVQLQQRTTDPTFVCFFLLSFAGRAQIEADARGSSGSMVKLGHSHLRAWRIVHPSHSEQHTIATFLDRQTAKLDTLVAKKRTLIERLKEKRTALISRTVTRGLPPDAARAAGLDPHPRLKPSGVEWLGEVPEGWEVSKIKFLARIESGHTPSRTVDEYWVDCNIPWVSLNDSKFLRTNDQISDTTYHINELGLANSSARILPEGAVVFSRDATVGLCAITTKAMAVSQHFVAYLCGPRLVGRYLLLSLKVMGQLLERLSLGATIATIGMNDVRSLECAVPPLPEQQAIATYLDQETTKIDRLIAKVETAIERLQEYRSALITAAVTGQIDVRDEGEEGAPSHA